jgi:hypothetical protein
MLKHEGSEYFREEDKVVIREDQDRDLGRYMTNLYT